MELEEWIDTLFGKTSKHKKRDIVEKLSNHFGTLDNVYEQVTDSRLEKRAEIKRWKDRQIIIRGVYDYYCRNSKLTQDQMTVHNALVKAFSTTTKMMKYFVGFMNIYDKCDSQTIHHLTDDMIKQDLDMDESIFKRRQLIHDIQANLNLH